VKASLLLLAALLLLPSVAAAQTGTIEREIDIAQMRTAPGPDPLLGGEGTALAEPGRLVLGTTLGWVDRPLVVADPSGGDDAALVNGRLGLDFGVAVGVLPWLELGAMLPVVLYQSGASEVGDRQLPALATAGTGDLRLRAKISLLSSVEDGFGVGFVVEGLFPTAVLGGFAGNDGFGMQAMILADFRLLGFHLALGAGYRVRPERVLGDLDVDDEIVWSAAARVPLPADFGILLQAQGAHGVLGPDGAFGAQDENPVLLHLGVDLPALGDLRAVVGGGMGVTSGYGAPRFDLFLQVRYAPRDHDRDADAILDHADECPEIPEDEDGFEDGDGCPDEDNDGDGVLDLIDSCPDDAEDRDGVGDDDGCPETDYDEDGVADEDDECDEDPEDEDGVLDGDGCPDDDSDGDGIDDPLDECDDEPEDQDGFEDGNGCPDPDNDGDRIEDGSDRCPDEPEDLDGHEDEDGCPEPDNDGDGVDDVRDRCPDEAGGGDGGEDDDGCPE